MNKLFFNPKTKSIVFNHGKEYYDMRNGQKTEEGKYPYLKPFDKEFKTKWFPETPELYDALNALGAEQVEFGYKISFRGKDKEVLPLFVEIKDQQYRLEGKFPYYFLKTFSNLLHK